MTPRRRLGKTPRAARLVLSSDEESESDSARPGAADVAPRTPNAHRPRDVGPEEDVIDLTLTSPESDSPATKPPPRSAKASTKRTTRKPPAAQDEYGVPSIPLFLDDSDSDDSEGAAAHVLEHLFPDDSSDEDDNAGILIL